MSTAQTDEDMQKQVAAFVVVARMQQRLLPRIGVHRRARSIDTYECYQDLLNNIDPTTWRRYFRFTNEEMQLLTLHLCDPSFHEIICIA